MWGFRHLRNLLVHEKGFIKLSWRELSTHKIHYSKILALAIVVSSTVSALGADYEDIQPGGSVHGIRAAVCALGAAAIVLVNMVSAQTMQTIARPTLDPAMRAVSGLLAVLAGGFWLLAETGGDVFPYLRVLVVNGTVSLLAFLWGLAMGIAMRMEEALQRLRGTEVPSEDRKEQ